jgi:prepilin-type N-terminal cleavage/methylation domain-containing protein
MTSCSWRRTNSARDRGFTLIELLIVMSIVAILASIVLPGLQARERARMAICISNVRQIGLGMKMYLGDQQRFPPIKTFDTDRQSKLTTQTIGGHSPVATHAPYWLSEEKRPLFSYIPPSRVYRCTTDRGTKHTRSSGAASVQPFPNAFETIGCSYSYNNGDCFCFAQRKARGVRPKETTGLALKPESWVRQPSKYILLYEPPAMTCSVTEWHFDRARKKQEQVAQYISPIAFVDGHVAVHDFTKAVNVDTEWAHEGTKDWAWYQPAPQ